MSSPSLQGRPGAAEPLQPQDLVITLLGLYVRPFGDCVWSGGLVSVLGDLGFSTGAARVALTRLVRRGLIARMREGRLVHYRVTPRADRLLAEGDGRIFSLGDPRDDRGTWTVLWHQIPEDRRLERSRLARRLRFLGFGSLQDSVWVSPHDQVLEVARLIEELGVSDFATVFVALVGTAGGLATRGLTAGGIAAKGLAQQGFSARGLAGQGLAAQGLAGRGRAAGGRAAGRLAAAGLAALVSRAWDLSSVVERYESFHAEFSPYLRRAARVRLQDSEAFLMRTRMVHLFRGFPTLDPELPEELAPLSRPRMRAVKTFHALFEVLAEPSQRHFDAATAVASARNARSSRRPSAVGTRS